MNTVFRSPTKEEWITNTLNEYMRNLYSNEYYLIIRENKAWKKKPKTKKTKQKNRLAREFNPWSLRHQCSALPTELTS